MQTDSRPNITLAQSVKRENSPNSQLDRLLSSKNTIQAVREMPTPSLLLLIKEVGLSDCHELLELLSPGQVQEHVDLDVWVGDRIDFKIFGGWLEALFAANPRKAIQQIHGLDFDIICFLFKSHAAIFDTEQGEEPLGNLNLHTITPGQRYIIAFFEEEANESNGIGHSLKQYLESLYERDLRFVYLLMEAIRHETSSSLEESAYGFRHSRLADMGFPERSEALSIFSYVDPEKARLQPEYIPYTLPQVAASNFILQIAPQNTSVSLAMQSLEPHVRLQVEHALIYLVNQVFVVRNGGNFDLDTMKKSGEFAMSTLGLGLRYLSEDKPENFGIWLAKLSPQQIFRTGFSLIIKLQRQWRTLARKFELQPENIAALDFPLKEVVHGINLRVPAFFNNLADPSNASYTLFSDLSQVSQSARALSHAVFRAALVGPAALNADFAQHSAACHGVFFATYLCRTILSSVDHKEAPLERCSKEMLAAIFDRLEAAGEGKKIGDKDRHRAKVAARGLALKMSHVWPQHSLEDLESKAVLYADIALASVEEEFSRLSRAPDREFIHSLL